MKELLLSEGFSEEICYLMSCWNVESLDHTILNFLPNEVKSISTCFVLSWYTGFAVMHKAALLSQQKKAG